MDHRLDPSHASPASERRKAPNPKPSPLWTRTLHALDIVVLLVMTGSGLQIYNANPVFGGRGGPTVPTVLTLGGWLAGGRHWHFGFMGLYALNLGLWIALLWRWRRQRLAQLGDVSTLGQSQSAPKRRLAAHRLVYTLMLVVLAFSLLTGLALYKPASLWWLSGLFGSWSVLRICHFATVPAMLALVIAHGVITMRIGGLRFLRTMFA
jgi:thiosulfate reductase cytochrome b subunit